MQLPVSSPARSPSTPGRFALLAIAGIILAVGLCRDTHVLRLSWSLFLLFTRVPALSVAASLYFRPLQAVAPSTILLTAGWLVLAGLYTLLMSWLALRGWDGFGSRAARRVPGGTWSLLAALAWIDFAFAWGIGAESPWASALVLVVLEIDVLAAIGAWMSARQWVTALKDRRPPDLSRPPAYGWTRVLLIATVLEAVIMSVRAAPAVKADVPGARVLSEHFWTLGHEARLVEPGRVERRPQSRQALYTGSLILGWPEWIVVAPSGRRIAWQDSTLWDPRRRPVVLVYDAGTFRVDTLLLGVAVNAQDLRWEEWLDRVSIRGTATRPRATLRLGRQRTYDSVARSMTAGCR